MIKCGFYNSKNGDRKYNAEDMTQPYKRLVSDGVYAMPAGQLKVTAAGGMKIQVSAGAAKVGSRWLESDAIETFTLDPSDVALNQIYAVVIRDDNSENVRKISIALKKGSLASNPTAPEIERSENITELKIAEVRVNKLVEEVTDADIKDTRADTTVCGWVTGLIDQVDTSDLFTQWESAYEQEHQRQQEQITNNQWEFDRWFDNIKDTFLTQATIVRRKTSEITTQSSGVKVIDINISDFNQDLDILSVFVNGFKLPESEYTYSATQITLNKALDTGSVVLVEALKSVDGKDAETTMQEYVKQEAKANAAIENANTAAQEARETAETTAATTATNTVNGMKGQPNGVAGLNASGKLQQMPTAADVGAIPSTDRNKANGVAGLNASGKVMQMPAAIADYVVEQGKSGTWTYRKWESGVAECWGAYTVSLESMDTGISGVSGRSGKITLPSGLFSGKPTAASVAVDWYYAEWETISINSASELSFRLYGNNNSGTIGSIGCNPYVIGRWK